MHRSSGEAAHALHFVNRGDLVYGLEVRHEGLGVDGLGAGLGVVHDAAVLDGARHADEVLEDGAEDDALVEGVCEDVLLHVLVCEQQVELGVEGGADLLAYLAHVHAARGLGYVLQGLVHHLVVLAPGVLAEHTLGHFTGDGGC